LRAQLLPKLVYFEEPAILMRPLSNLGPLRPGGLRGRVHLGLLEPLLELLDIPWERRRRRIGQGLCGGSNARRFFAPDSKHSSGLSGRTEPLVKYLPQEPVTDRPTSAQKLAADTTES